MKVQQVINKYSQVLLLCLCVLFAWILWLDLNRDYSMSLPDKVISETVIDPEISENLPGKKLSPLSEYSQIIERPLFREDRRPFVPVETVVEENKRKGKSPVSRMKPDELLLLAVIITNETRIALIQSGRNKKIRKVIVGEVIDDWTLDDVQPGLISLKKGDEVKTLELLIKSSPKQSPSKSIRRVNAAGKTPEKRVQRASTDKTQKEVSKKERPEKVLPGEEEDDT